MDLWWWPFFSVADGVALGAAVTTSKTEVEVIVFVAIMLHKVWVLFLFFGNLAWCEIEFVCPLGEGMFCLLWKVIIGLLLSEVFKD